MGLNADEIPAMQRSRHAARIGTIDAMMLSPQLDVPSSRAALRHGLRIAALGLALGLGGCSSLGGFGDWFGSKDKVVALDEPADKLYNEGLYLLNSKKDRKAAAKRFEEVDRQHPYSEWSRKALLMSAFSYYEAGEYDEAISSAKRYLSLHPSSPDAAYAQFILGSAYYDQIADVSRDQQRTERAIAALDEVVRKYPNTEYAISAKRKMDVGRDTLAGKEMTIGRYYLDRRNYTAAINRFKVVVTQYQTTRHVEEALMRLTESYMALGIVGEAQTAAAVLGHNFPDSQWYKDAYTLVKSGGLEPRVSEGSWITRAFKRVGLG
jgi:outer membrane protein assembly factor BamD